MQVVGKEPEQENRFYTAFYRKLLDPQIGVANKRAVFLNLLYRVLRSDKSLTRLYAFVKRIFQIVAYFPASMSCATLYVVSQVLQTRKDLQMIVSSRYSAVKTENDENSAFNENSASSKPEEKSEGSDEEERTNGKPAEDFIMLSNVRIEPVKDPAEDCETEAKDVVKIEDDAAAFYDPFCLNPLRSGAMKTPLAELEALSLHFHPSVALFASTIVQGNLDIHSRNHTFFNNVAQVGASHISVKKILQFVYFLHELLRIYFYSG